MDVALDKRLDKELRDAGIPESPRAEDMGLVMIEPGALERDSPKFSPRLLEVEPIGGCGVGTIGSWVPTLGGEGPLGWLLVLGRAEEGAELVGFEFLARRLGCCWGC